MKRRALYHNDVRFLDMCVTQHVLDVGYAVPPTKLDMGIVKRPLIRPFGHPG